MIKCSPFLSLPCWKPFKSFPCSAEKKLKLFYGLWNSTRSVSFYYLLPANLISYCSRPHSLCSSHTSPLLCLKYSKHSSFSGPLSLTPTKTHKPGTYPFLHSDSNFALFFFPKLILPLLKSDQAFHLNISPITINLLYILTFYCILCLFSRLGRSLAVPREHFLPCSSFQFKLLTVLLSKQ